MSYIHILNMVWHDHVYRIVTENVPFIFSSIISRLFNIAYF